MPPGLDLAGFGELQILFLCFLEVVKVTVKIRRDHLARMENELAMPLPDQLQPL